MNSVIYLIYCMYKRNFPLTASILSEFCQFPKRTDLSKHVVKSSV
jgi:hypothetical protein